MVAKRGDMRRIYSATNGSNLRRIARLATCIGAFGCAEQGREGPSSQVKTETIEQGTEPGPSAGSELVEVTGSSTRHSTEPECVMPTSSLVAVGAVPSATVGAADSTVVPRSASCDALADAGFNACADAGPLCPSDRTPHFCDDHSSCYCGSYIRHSSPP